MSENTKVLAVDDDAEILTLMAEVLPTLGCDVLLACDGAAALERFHAERPSVVVTDLKLPGMDGLALMKAIKEASPRTEILIITAYADLESAIQAVRQGAFDYLPKPFDVETLRHRLGQALERHRLVSEKEALLEELERRVEARTAALVESQRRLRAVFHGVKDSLVIVDRAFAIVAANSGAAAVSGTPAETLIGRHCYRELFGREEICDGCPVLETFVTGRPADRAMSRSRSGGGPRFLRVAAYPLADEGKPQAEALEHIRDITDKVLEARHVQNAEKLAAVGELAAGVAHEMGNVLAIIQGSVQLLLGYPNDRRSATREHLEAIHRSVALADHTVRGLLTFAKPGEASLQAVAVTEPLDRAQLLLKGEFGRRGVRIARRYAPDLPPIQGDPEQLQQVFVNLLMNACEAMDGGGAITITAGFDLPEWVCVEMTDTGRGISKEHLGRIFDPFFTRRKGGTGLGLSVAHRHVEAHGGRLTVDSREGQGTRVTILLPALIPQKAQALVG